MRAGIVEQLADLPIDPLRSWGLQMHERMMAFADSPTCRCQEHSREDVEFNLKSLHRIFHQEWTGADDAEVDRQWDARKDMAKFLELGRAYMLRRNLELAHCLDRDL